MRLRADATHPLMALKPQALRNWAEWQNRWATTTFHAEYLGLLHCGFDITPDERGGVYWRDAAVEKLCFFLELADGHTNEAFWFSDERRGEDTAAKNRAELCKKAFAVLASGFFQNKNGENELPSWFRVATEERALKKLIWFFLRDENMTPWERSRTSNVPLERAITFVTDLCKFGWYKGGFSLPDIDEDCQERLAAARPDFVEILCVLGKQALLLKRTDYPLDEACWSRLKEVSLTKRQIWVPDKDGHGKSIETRAPKTIQEAIANGSRSAQVFHILQAMRQEDERLQRAIEAHHALREAERRVAQT